MELLGLLPECPADVALRPEILFQELEASAQLLGLGLSHCSSHLLSRKQLREPLDLLAKMPSLCFRRCLACFALPISDSN